jgi:alanine-synthesizing transaminase
VFSRRTAWDLEPAAPAPAADVLDLTISNPTAVGFTWPAEFWRRLADERSARYEPDALGHPDARAAVAAWYAARHARHAVAAAAIDPAAIGLCASTSEAYSHLLALLCDPGDVVLVPQPGYPLLRVLAELADVRLVAYPLRHDVGWSIDLDALDAILESTPNVRAVVAVAPNNPTGNYLHAHELATLDALLAARDAALLVDEVFHDYPLVPGPHLDTTSVPATALTFTLSGLSKIAALPQIKLAWWLARGPTPRVRGALARLEVIADTFLGVATPVQHALSAILRDAPAMQAQISRRLHTNLATLRRLAPAAAISVLDVDAGWLALLRLPAVHDLDDAAWAERLLARRRVRLQPGHLYDLAGPHLAVSLLTPERDLAAGLARVADEVAEVLASGPCSR